MHWPRLIASLALVQAFLSAHGNGEKMCFNQLQMLGTHNSYHVAPDAKITQDGLSNPVLAPLLALIGSSFMAWQYTHLPLDQQLQLGVRGLELDIHADPLGGGFDQAVGLRLAGRSGWLDIPELKEPGFKVLHLPDVDFNSTCRTFKSCLAIIRGWSVANPTHLPLVIMLENKRNADLDRYFGSGSDPLIDAILEGLPAPGPDRLTLTPELNSTLFAALEEEILEVFDRSAVIAPDDVRGGDPSVDLKELLLVPPGGPCPWPDLDSMRGKVMFNIKLRSEDFDAYEELHPRQEGALLWLLLSSRSLDLPGVFLDTASWGIRDVDSNFTLDADAAIEVIQMAELVRSKVQEGYIVRARADAETVEARNNFTARRDALIEAGAHVISTDYLQPSQLFPSTYKVCPPLLTEPSRDGCPQAVFDV